jgi:hypothetical protein
MVLEPLAQIKADRQRRARRLSASDALKSQWLPRIAGGEALVVLAPPGAQAALLAVYARATATRTGDSWSPTAAP